MIDCLLTHNVVQKIINAKKAPFFFQHTLPIRFQNDALITLRYFFDNAISATFVGRLIPVIRQLISIPAGFSKMPFGPFVFYTALGSTIWVSILAALGYFIGANQELLARYYKEIIWVLFIFGVLWFGWKFFQAINKKNSV